MPEIPNNETRERILDAAEDLFSKRGYAGVKLRDIAGAVDIHHASLYYYAPRGKEQLFTEVLERNFKRHREGLTLVIREAGDDIGDQMHAVARWLVSQPMLDIGRMQESDMRSLPAEEAERLMAMGYNAVRVPIAAALRTARNAGQIDSPDLNLTAMAIVSLIESVHAIPAAYVGDFREQVAHQLVDMLLNGLYKR